MYENIQPLSGQITVSKSEVYPDGYGAKLPKKGHLILSDSRQFAAMNVETGEVDWTYYDDTEIGASVIGVVGDDTFLILSGSNRIKAIRDNGDSYTLLWTFVNPTNYQMVGIMAPVLGSGSVYYHTVNYMSSPVRVHCLCVQGGEIDFDIAYTEISTNQVGVMGAYAFGKYYFGSMQMHCIDSDGEVIFANKSFRDAGDEMAGSVVDVGPSLLLVGGTLFDNDYNQYGKLYGVNPASGNKVFSFTPEDPCDTPTAIAYEDRVVACFGYDNNIYLVDYAGGVLHKWELDSNPWYLPLAGVTGVFYYWLDEELRAVDINDYSVRFCVHDGNDDCYGLVPWDDKILFSFGYPYFVKYSGEGGLPKGDVWCSVLLCVGRQQTK